MVLINVYRMHLWLTYLSNTKYMSKTALQAGPLFEPWDDTVNIGPCKAVRNSRLPAMVKLVYCISENTLLYSAGAARGLMRLSSGDLDLICGRWSMQYHAKNTGKLRQ
jgi:hypothetical protein